MITFRSFETSRHLGTYAAGRIAKQLLDAIQRRGLMTLGCPSGRTGRPIYDELGRLAAEERLDLSRLHILMMDEFVEQKEGRFVHCSPDAHFSCAGFAERQIRQVLNAGLPLACQVPAANVHIPGAECPSVFEGLIDSLGGIDCFILASGASDGHVAFNPAGTGADKATRIVELAQETRRDNMASFPEFQDIADVPRWGTTVGPRTISRATRTGILVLTGQAKGKALARVLSVRHYDPGWPASIIHECACPEILIDQQSADALINMQRASNGAK